MIWHAGWYGEESFATSDGYSARSKLRGIRHSYAAATLPNVLKTWPRLKHNGKLPITNNLTSQLSLMSSLNVNSGTQRFAGIRRP
ncbi:hypothetical protein ACVMAJ_001350 [Bradyrhizobium sp. USDA 4448]